MDLLYVVLMIVVAVNKGWAPAPARFLVAVERWVIALLAHVLLVTNERPAFGLDAYR